MINRSQYKEISCQKCNKSWNFDFLVNEFKIAPRIDNGSIYYDFMKKGDFTVAIHAGTSMEDVKKGLLVVLKCPSCTEKDDASTDNECLFCMPAVLSIAGEAVETKSR
jgi:hypothetical protein